MAHGPSRAAALLVLLAVAGVSATPRLADLGGGRQLMQQPKKPCPCSFDISKCLKVTCATKEGFATVEFDYNVAGCDVFEGIRLRMSKKWEAFLTKKTNENSCTLPCGKYKLSAYDAENTVCAKESLKVEMGATCVTPGACGGELPRPWCHWPTTFDLCKDAKKTCDDDKNECTTDTSYNCACPYKFKEEGSSCTPTPGANQFVECLVGKCKKINNRKIVCDTQLGDANKECTAGTIPTVDVPGLTKACVASWKCGPKAQCDDPSAAVTTEEPCSNGVNDKEPCAGPDTCATKSDVEADPAKLGKCLDRPKAVNTPCGGEGDGNCDEPDVCDGTTLGCKDAVAAAGKPCSPTGTFDSECIDPQCAGPAANDPKECLPNTDAKDDTLCNTKEEMKPDCKKEVCSAGQCVINYFKDDTVCRPAANCCDKDDKCETNDGGKTYMCAQDAGRDGDLCTLTTSFDNGECTTQYAECGRDDDKKPVCPKTLKTGSCTDLTGDCTSNP